MEETSGARPLDLTRQIVMISATVFMLIGDMVGIGLFGGTSVQDLQGGALDSDASYLSPARSAFSIWGLIYLFLIAYTVWQALPGQRASGRQRAIGWWIALTAVLNGLWLVTAQLSTLPVTVAAIIALLVALAITFQRTVAHPAEGFVDKLLIDGGVGLHLGWVTLATVANIAAWLTASGVQTDAADVWGVVVLIAVAAIGVGIALLSRGRVAPSIPLAWGLAWLAVARLTDEPHSTAIGVTAIVVAVLVLLAPVIVLAGRSRRVSA